MTFGFFKKNILIAAAVMGSGSTPTYAAETSSSTPPVTLAIEGHFAVGNTNDDAIETVNLWVRINSQAAPLPVTLTEIGKDSTTFRGELSLSDAEVSELSVLVYGPILPEKTSSRTEGKSIGELNIFEQKRPYLLQKEKGRYRVTVFSNAQSLLEAQKKYRVAKGMLNLSQQKKQKSSQDLKNLITLPRLETIKGIDAALTTQRAQREQLFEERHQKQSENERRWNKMPAEKKQKAVAAARKLFEEGQSLFQEGAFRMAERKFSDSLQTNPTDTRVYFYQGVALFKMGKLNEALVALRLAPELEINALERSLLRGLSYLRLKEYPEALEELAIVSSVSDAQWAPLASLYMGLILRAQADYELAKTAFETTIEISENPDLDRQAEAHLQQIAKQEALEAALPKRFEGSVVTGLVYDSNILLASNSSPTSVSERGGYRGLLNIALDYRPLVQWDYDLGLQANYIDLKSVDLQGKASETLAMLDPRLMGASLPLRWRTQLWGQQQQIVLSAGTENLSLNSDGVGNRETIMSSTKASLETTFMLKEDHLTSLKLDWRDENALVSSELFSDATKMKITNSHVFFEDRKQRGDSVSVTMSYLNHMAKEDRFSYNRFAIGAGMVRSAFASTKWSHQLNLASTNRQLIRKIQEANIHWSSQWLSSITPSLQSSVGFGLESNLSTEEIFRYQKYTLSATLQWLTSM